MERDEMISELQRIGRALGDMQHELVVTGDQGLQVKAAQLQRRVAVVVAALSGEPAPTADYLPGMWEEADLIGGATDCLPAPTEGGGPT